MGRKKGGALALFLIHGSCSKSLHTISQSFYINNSLYLIFQNVERRPGTLEINLLSASLFAFLAAISSMSLWPGLGWRRWLLLLSRRLNMSDYRCPTRMMLSGWIASRAGTPAIRRIVMGLVVIVVMMRGIGPAPHHISHCVYKRSVRIAHCWKCLIGNAIIRTPPCRR